LRTPRTFPGAADVAYSALLVAIVATLFAFGPPTDDSFSWPDSPRHALNGAFVLDLLRDHPVHGLKAYAFNYYSKYPALTILFYPPLFYFILAAFYLVFGVSQSAALVAEFACYAALAIGVYRLAKSWLPATAAFGVALILAASPEIAYWGRQVMLDVPSLAFLVWSAVFFQRHLEQNRAPSLYIAAALLILAMYTKISAGFLGIAYVAMLLQHRGMAVFKDRNTYWIAALSVIAIIPLVILTLEFGQENVRSVAGIADVHTSPASLSGWIYYAKQLPAQMGWAAFLAAALGLVVAALQRERAKAALFLFLWLAAGYIFFSAIDLKSARYSIVLLPPLSILAGCGAVGLLRGRPLMAGTAVCAIGAFTLVATVMWRPVEFVEGYDSVADFIARTAPKDTNVAFSGFRDGSFIFAMRAHGERRDLSIVRVDKLLLRIAIKRSLGVQDKGYSAEQIGQMLDRLGVQFVVAQPGFWVDLSSMREFEKLLHGPHFQPVRRFAMRADYNAQEKELVVYRNLDHVAHGPIRLDTEIPMIGRSVSGVVGTKN
jgi:hypothetical protein